MVSLPLWRLTIELAVGLVASIATAIAFLAVWVLPAAILLLAAIIIFALGEHDHQRYIDWMKLPPDGEHQDY